MQTLGKLSIRVLSITLMVKSFLILINYFTYYLPHAQRLNAQDIQIEFGFIPFLSTMLVALPLWIFADKIVVWMIGEDNTDSIVFNINYHQLLHIVLKAVGIIIITTAIPSFITKTTQFLQLNLNLYDFRGKVLQLSYVLIPIFQMLVGAILIFSNRYLKSNNHQGV